MSTSEGTALDAQAIRELVQKLNRQELALFQGIIVDIRNRGTGLSDTVVEELAKKYADKARLLAGDGGEQ